MIDVKYIIGLIVLMTSCDCVQRVNGYILDSRTKKQLDSVVYSKEGKNNIDYTDSLGYFNYRGISGRLFGCPDIELTFSKKGYTSVKRKFDSYSEGDTIYLDKSN